MSRAQPDSEAGFRERFAELELELDPESFGGSWEEALAEARRGEPDVTLVSLAKRIGRDLLLLAEMTVAGKQVNASLDCAACHY